MINNPTKVISLTQFLSESYRIINDPRRFTILGLTEDKDGCEVEEYYIRAVKWNVVGAMNAVAVKHFGDYIDLSIPYKILADILRSDFQECNHVNPDYELLFENERNENLILSISACKSNNCGYSRIMRGFVTAMDDKDDIHYLSAPKI